MNSEPASTAPPSSEQRLNSLKSTVAPTLLLAVGLGFASGLLLIAQALILARVVSDVMIGGAGLKEVMPRLAWLPPLMLVRAALAWTSERVAFAASATVRHDLRTRLFRHLLDIGPLRQRNEQAGEVATVVMDGVEALEGYYARYLPHLGVMALVPLAVLAAVYPADWISATIMVATAPFIPFFTILIGKGAEQLNQRQWRKLARLGGYFLDRVNGLATLKMFNASRREAEIISRISDEYRQTTMSVLYIAFLSALTLEFFATVSVAVMAVIIGFRLLKGGMAFQDGFTVLLLAPEFYLPLRSMGSHYHARMEAIGAAERIFALLDRPVSRPVPPASTVDDGVSCKSPENPLPSGGGGSGWGGCCPSINVSFENVSFHYEADAPPALAGINLILPSVGRVALAGPSGSGKSTLAALLLGFAHPDSGRITVNGIDLREYDPEQWRRLVAWIPQRPRIFHGTVADNIRLGCSGVSDEALRRAVRRAGCDEFIARLPDGMNQIIGELGAGLSGGQARRISVARAFLKDAPLIVMDEPTAGLDARSEALVHEALIELGQGRTVLQIAHRLATLRDAGRIVVMHQGRVMEEGRYADLVNNGGPFAEMVLSGGVA